MLDTSRLVKQIKNQENFLKWMARRYLEENPEQAAAFTSGAELFKELRQEIRDGEFDIQVKEELTVSRQQLEEDPFQVDEEFLRRLDDQAKEI